MSIIAGASHALLGYDIAIKGDYFSVDPIKEKIADTQDNVAAQ